MNGLQAFRDETAATVLPAMGNFWSTVSHHIRVEEDSLVLSWASLAAIFSICSVLVTASMVYLRAVWGKDLTAAASSLSKEIIATQVVITDRVRSEIKEAILPLERRVEKLEDN